MRARGEARGEERNMKTTITCTCRRGHQEAHCWQHIINVRLQKYMHSFFHGRDRQTRVVRKLSTDANMYICTYVCIGLHVEYSNEW